MKNNNLVYKFYDKDNMLLYVGITNNIAQRLKQHKESKIWFNDVESIYVSDCMTRNETHLYEIFYISNDKPKYNVDYAKGGNVNIELPEIKFEKYYSFAENKKIHWIKNASSLDKTEIGKSLEWVYLDINDENMLKACNPFVFELLTVNNCLEDFVCYLLTLFFGLKKKKIVLL